MDDWKHELLRQGVSTGLNGVGTMVKKSSTKSVYRS